MAENRDARNVLFNRIRWNLKVENGDMRVAQKLAERSGRGAGRRA